jgi:hypothetical protein
MTTDGLPNVTLTCENRRSPEGAVNTPGPLGTTRPISPEEKRPCAAFHHETAPANRGARE